MGKLYTVEISYRVILIISLVLRHVLIDIRMTSMFAKKNKRNGPLMTRIFSRIEIVD